MKKIFFVLCALIIIISNAAVLPAYGDVGISKPTAALNGNTVTCSFNISGLANSGSDFTLLAVTKSALVDGDLPDSSALNESNVVYIDQQKVEANGGGSCTFVIADEFKSEPFRVFIGAPAAEKVFVDVDAGAALGVSLSGAIKSFNPKNPVTVRLMAGSVVKFESVISAANGTGQVEQSFSIDGVAPGTYTLVVSKAGHLKYTVNNIVVGNQNANFMSLLNAQSSTVSLVCGDINGDGQIDVRDLSVIIDNFGRNSATVSNPLADQNGDGQVDVRDLSPIIDGFGKTNTVVP